MNRRRPWMNRVSDRVAMYTDVHTSRPGLDPVGGQSGVVHSDRTVVHTWRPQCVESRTRNHSQLVFNVRTSMVTWS